MMFMLVDVWIFFIDLKSKTLFSVKDLRVSRLNTLPSLLNI